MLIFNVLMGSCAYQENPKPGYCKLAQLLAILARLKYIRAETSMRTCSVMGMESVWVMACFATLLALTPAQAQTSLESKETAPGSGAVPRLIRFSGTLGAAELKPGGLVGVEFAIYQEESGSVALWSEIQNVEPDSSGHFSVLLGATRN